MFTSHFLIVAVYYFNGSLMNEAEDNDNSIVQCWNGKEVLAIIKACVTFQYANSPSRLSDYIRNWPLSISFTIC